MPRRRAPLPALTPAAIEAVAAAAADATRVAVREVLRKLAEPPPPLAVVKPEAIPRGETKRTAREMRAVEEACLRVIRAQPGILAEQIASELGLETLDVMLPLEHLRNEKRVTTRGKARYTRYTAA